MSNAAAALETSPANDNAYAAFDSAAIAAKPRIHALAGWRNGFSVSYRGVVATIFGVGDSRREGSFAWWMVKLGDAEVARGETGESALGKWTAELDARAELERVKARKPGKAVTHTGIPTYGNGDLSATVVPNRSVRVVLTRRGETVDQTYTIGGSAEYKSFNTSFFGTIVAIGAKTVAIEGMGRRHRLTIENFAQRNSEPVARKHKRNAEWCD
jgi:hypothetical protein